jgi:hypothetical protein
MANFLANTRPAPGVQLGFFKDRYYGGNSYYHYKTNIPMNNTMCMIEAIGYSYGSNIPIRTAWCFYTYAPANTTISVGLQDAYSGLSAHGVYSSSDGYAVIRATGASYYSGWVFNAYCLNPTGYNFNVGILASVQTDNAGNYY